MANLELELKQCTEKEKIKLHPKIDAKDLFEDTMLFSKESNATLLESCHNKKPFKLSKRTENSIQPLLKKGEKPRSLLFLGKNLYTLYRDLKKSEQESLLGSGAWGIVKLVQNVATQKWSAVKISKRKKYSHRVIDCEIDILKSLGRLQESEWINGKMYIVQDLICGVKLNEFHNHLEFSMIAKERPKDALKKLLSLTITILQSMEKVHNIPVCHNDLMPCNVMVDPDTGIGTVVDFGTSFRKEDAEFYGWEKDRLLREIQNEKLTIIQLLQSYNCLLSPFSSSLFTAVREKMLSNPHILDALIILHIKFRHNMKQNDTDIQEYIQILVDAYQKTFNENPFSVSVDKHLIDREWIKYKDELQAMKCFIANQRQMSNHEFIKSMTEVYCCELQKKGIDPSDKIKKMKDEVGKDWQLQLQNDFIEGLQTGKLIEIIRTRILECREYLAHRKTVFMQPLGLLLEREEEDLLGILYNFTSIEKYELYLAKILNTPRVTLHPTLQKTIERLGKSPMCGSKI
jgi:tRNA A-37 threonylcarbamoyl transferase component Bud32